MNNFDNKKENYKNEKIPKMKKYIYDYIKEKFSNQMFDKANYITNNTFFDISYEEFLIHNNVCIGDLTYFRLKTIYNMCILFQSENVIVSDEELIEDREVIQIYFNSDSQLTIACSFIYI